MNRMKIGLFAIITGSACLFVFSGCEKPEDTIATITVVNLDGEPIPGATVRIFSNPTPPPQPNELRFDDTSVTNGTGKVSFNFTDYYKQGQAGFAVLDLEAWKGSLYGTGIIKIEEETTTEEVVEIE
ncbi:MAG: hypothetical protein JNM00_12625 [Flavobacteriales bacterium]|nr:hypothetical protein [Flavobacteriales bacterium]